MIGLPWIIGAGLAFGLGAGEVRRFERSAAADIAAKLQGPNKKVSVRSQIDIPFGILTKSVRSATIFAQDFSIDELPLYAEEDRSKEGKLGTLNMRMKNFRLCGLLVDEMTATIPGCRFDFALAMSKRQIRLSKSGVGVGEVKISEAALAEFILKKFPEIKTITVNCDRDYLWLEGFGEFLIIQTHFRVLAKLVSRDGIRLELTRARVAFDGLPAEAEVAQTVLDTLNPVVDLNRDLKLQGAIFVKGVETSNGILRAWGDTKIPKLPVPSRAISQPAPMNILGLSNQS